MTYAEKLKDPRWQKKRLEVLQASGFTCSLCGSSDRTLHVHHRYYIHGRMPWEYPGFCFQCLCFQCHESVPEFMDEQRENGGVIFENWEIGLDHFGDSIINVALDDIENRDSEIPTTP